MTGFQGFSFVFCMVDETIEDFYSILPGFCYYLVFLELYLEDFLGVDEGGVIDFFFLKPLIKYFVTFMRHFDWGDFVNKFLMMSDVVVER